MLQNQLKIKDQGEEEVKIEMETDQTCINVD
jgi:hypothetical protein